MILNEFRRRWFANVKFVLEIFIPMVITACTIPAHLNLKKAKRTTKPKPPSRTHIVSLFYLYFNDCLYFNIFSRPNKKSQIWICLTVWSSQPAKQLIKKYNFCFNYNWLKFSFFALLLFANVIYTIQILYYFFNNLSS